MKKSIEISFLGVLILWFVSATSFAEHIIWSNNDGVIIQHFSSPSITKECLFNIPGIDWNSFGLGTSESFTTNNVNTNELSDIVVIKVMEEIEAKHAFLLSVANLYKAFLTNEWTPCLRNYGIISNNVIIDYTNTSTLGNMNYLMTIRNMDTNSIKPTYSYFKGEFESFRINIERLGGNIGSLP